MVNSKADQIARHFGDRSALGLDIHYLRETKPRGTWGGGGAAAGAGKPRVVTNGDVLAKVDCGHVMDSHLEAGADATVVVRDYQMPVPFGVINAADGQILRIDEKPTPSFTISAGAYVLSPSALRLVRCDAYHDMPTLLADMIGAGLAALRGWRGVSDGHRAAALLCAGERDFGAVFQG